jgi:hypothetical protein
VDTTTPRYKRLEAKAKADAIEWLRGELEAQGLSDTIKVGEEYVTKAQLDKLAAQTKAEQAAARKRILEALGR